MLRALRIVEQAAAPCRRPSPRTHSGRAAPPARRLPRPPTPAALCFRRSRSTGRARRAIRRKAILPARSNSPTCSKRPAMPQSRSVSGSQRDRRGRGDRDSRPRAAEGRLLPAWLIACSDRRASAGPCPHRSGRKNRWFWARLWPGIRRLEAGAAACLPPPGDFHRRASRPPPAARRVLPGSTPGDHVELFARHGQVLGHEIGIVSAHRHEARQIGGPGAEFCRAWA